MLACIDREGAILTQTSQKLNEDHVTVRCLVGRELRGVRCNNSGGWNSPIGILRLKPHASVLFLIVHDASQPFLLVMA